MNLLLDAHAVIWFITEDSQMPKKSKNIVESTDNNCLASIASLWEMGIKYSLGKLELRAEKTIPNLKTNAAI
jgi:PIN domain nuclease of toxin-antitoxin system